jgi:hypothetical protein
MGRGLALAGFVLIAGACDQSVLTGVSPTAPEAATFTTPSKTFTLSGLVFETAAAGVQPVSGVGILRELRDASSLSGESGWTTDANGRYAIEGLPSNSRVAVAVFTGGWHQPCAVTATMTSDVTLDIEIARIVGGQLPSSRTLRSSPTLSGTLFQRLSDGQRHPAPMTEVYYMNGCRGTVLARTYTDAAGRYELCRLPISEGCVQVNRSTETDYSFQNTPVVIRGDTNLDIELER